jgi:chromosome segregation ATPase
VYWKKGFRIMLKKLLIAAVAVVVGLVVVQKTSLGSYVRVWWKNARLCASRQVPVETEIERLRDELARIGKDSTKYFQAMAEDIEAVKELKRDITRHEANLERQKKNVLTLKEDLASGNAFVFYGDTKYSRERIKSQLAHDFEAYKAAEASLAAKRKLLEVKEQNLTAAKDRMRAMQETRRDLEVELARLEAEHKTVLASQTRSKTHFDDSELSRIKKGVADLRTRINVQKTALEVEAEYSGGPIPVTERVKEKDLLKAIDSHFDAEKKGDKVAAQK